MMKLLGHFGVTIFKAFSIMWDLIIIALVLLAVLVLWPIKWLTDPKPPTEPPKPIRASEAFPIRSKFKKKPEESGGWLWAIIWRFLMLLVILVVHGYRKGKR